ncbi:MAG TPA: FecR family protein [Bacteroidales bacterium]|nr:FecR family protein [Bacteroidales bacterium]
MEDFILNDSFREFVAGDNKQAVDYWMKWIEQHPESVDEFNEAIETVTILLKARVIKNKDEKEKSLNILLHTIDSIEKPRHNPMYRISQAGWMKIAAVLLTGLFITVFLSVRNLHKAIAPGQAVFSVIVPEGEKSQIILSDSTKIWINSGSKLTYPATFGKATREVYLEGEAFFDVTHNDKLPFVVTTNEILIKVLGTSFNVKSYADEGTVETTVVRGKVRIDSRTHEKTVFLSPNEKAIFHKEKREMEVTSPTAKIPMKTKEIDLKNLPMPVTIRKVNPEPITSWKDQHLIFSDETLEDMIVRMERWYDVKIVLKDNNLKTQRYTGKFVHNETIYQVLEAIEMTTPIDYEAGEGQIFIYNSKTHNSN